MNTQEKIVEEVLKRVRGLEEKENNSLDKRIQTLFEGAKKEAEKLGIPVVISVVDEAGNLVFFYRMPKALLISSELSPNKAYTAVALQCATHELDKITQPGQDLYQIESMVHRKIVTFGGGMPICKGGCIIGGLGVSGGTVEQDIMISKAAITYMEEKYGK